jgi:hypothetical protein
MTKPIVVVHNTETDKVIEREMTAAEVKVYDADIERVESHKAEAQAKAEARKAILDRLGLTADEASILLG